MQVYPDGKVKYNKDAIVTITREDRGSFKRPTVIVSFAGEKETNIRHFDKDEEAMKYGKEIAKKLGDGTKVNFWIKSESCKPIKVGQSINFPPVYIVRNGKIVEYTDKMHFEDVRDEMIREGNVVNTRIQKNHKQTKRK